MKVLIIAVHPDDETLGCGATLLRHLSQNDELHWLIVTQTYAPQWSQETMDKKAAEIEAVAEAYQFKAVYKLKMPTVKLDIQPQAELISQIGKITNKVKPNVVYLNHDGDIHTDHHAVFTATMSVFKPFYMKSWGIHRILCYETLSSTEAAPPFPSKAFLPTIYHDISPYMDRKIEIMNLYQSEIQKEPLPRSPSAIYAQARFRGATIGVEYAEAFMLVREII